MPTHFGPYEVIDALGEGGMGSVYRARKSQGGPDVAVKSLRQGEDTSFDAMQALRREFDTLRQLQHPHIVRVVDANLEASSPWYAMEFIAGASLAALVHAGDDPSTAPTLFDVAGPTVITPQNSDEAAVSRPRHTPHGWDAVTRTALTWLAQVTHALGYMHGEGLVHGDLKPENIVVASDRAYLVDFGLAARVEGRVTIEGMRRAELAAHTPAYVSPERLVGERLDPRADLYSLGCMIYELITGRVPFDGPPLQVMMAHRSKEPAPISEFVEDVPEPLVDLVQRLLAKSPTERVSHALDVLNVLETLGISGVTRPVPAIKPYLYPPPTVGRTDQLSAVARRMKRVKRAHGTVVILGPSGVGKSTLASRCIRIATEQKLDVLVSEGRRAGVVPDDSAAEPNLPFASLSGIFDALVDRLRSLPDSSAKEILGNDGIFLTTFEPRLEQWCSGEVPELRDPIRATCRALRNTLDRLFDRRGLLIVLDELQWLDTASRHAFEEFSVHAQDAPWLLLGLGRSEELSDTVRGFFTDAADDVIELEPLSLAQTREAVAGILGRPSVTEETARVVHDRTRGNPYFVREFLQLALEQGVLRRDPAGRWTGQSGEHLADALERLPIPDSVVEYTTQRLGSLSDSATSLLRAAAVLGRSFTLSVLRRTTSFEPARFERALVELTRRTLLEETSESAHLRFAHDRIREAVYSGIEPDSRQSLHRQSAIVLEASGAEPALVAWHFEQAGELEPATMHWVEAAEGALAQRAFDAAAKRFEAALRVGRHLSHQRRAELEAQRIAALRTSGDLLAAMVASEAFLDEVNYPIERARVLREVSRANLALGSGSDSLASAELALAEDGVDEQPELHVDCLNAKGDALSNLGEYDEAIEVYSKTLALTRATGLERLEYQTMNNIALAHYYQADYSAAMDEFTAAIDGVRRIGDRRRQASFSMNLANCYNDQGQYEKAIEWYDRALETAIDLGDEPAMAFVRANKGIALAELGRYEEALECYRLSEAYRRRRQMRGPLGILLLNTATVYSEQGHYERAGRLLDDALELIQDVGWRRPEAYTWAGIGRLMVNQGKYDEADGPLRNARELAEEIGERFVQCAALRDASWNENYRGNPEAALALAKEAVELANDIGNESCLNDARLSHAAALHRMGNVRDALDEFETAYDVYRKLGRHWYAALAACEAALACHTAVLDADVWLDRAREHLDAIDLEPEALPQRLWREVASLNAQ